MNFFKITAVTGVAIMTAGFAAAQEVVAESEWGDGAAYGGGRFVPNAGPSPVSSSAQIALFGGNSKTRQQARIRKHDAIGECFARITIPAKFRTDKREVVVQDTHKTLSFSEPKFEQGVERIKVRDEYVRYVLRQPRWEVETEEIVTRPAYERLTVVPAQWRYVDQTVDISVPRLLWKPGKHAGSDVTRTDPVTGTVFTLVEEPGKLRTYRKRVIAKPEQVIASSVPARSITITKRVLTDPGGVETETIPAEYREYNVERITQPARPVENTVPTLRETIETDIMISPERWEWAPVLCGHSLTPSAVRQIQGKLAQSGVFSGAIDGQIGQQTKSALRAFQESHGLQHDGELTLVTLERLGLSHLAVQ